MLPPAALSGGCCAAVRTLLHSPTTDATTPPASAPSQSRLASSHSFPPAPICCRRQRCLVAVAQRFVHFSTHPQPMQQHRQLPRRRNHGSLLPILSAALGQLQTPAPQVAVRSKRTQNVVRSLH